MANTEGLSVEISVDIREARNNLNFLREQLRNAVDPRVADRLNRRILTLGRSVMSTSRALNNMGTQAHEATRQAKGIETINTADVFNGINTISNAVINLTDKFNILGKIAELAFEKIKIGIKDFISAGHEFNKSMEQTKIAFETIIGNKKESDALIETLKTMGALTPFEFGDLAKTTKQLLIMGANLDAIPYMLKNIGDAASATELGAQGLKRITKALSDMKAKGMVSAQEMSRQLGELGIDAWGILAEKLNKTKAETKKLAEAGKLDADKTIEMLIDGFGESFPDLMDKFSQTWDGLMSTIRDNLTQISAFLQTKFFDKFKKYLSVVADNLVYLVNLLKITKDPILAIQAALERAFGSDVMQGIMPFIYLVNSLFISLKNSIVAIFKAVAPVIIALLKKIAPFINFITALITGLGQAFVGLPPFVQLLIVVVGVLSSVFIALIPIFVTIGTLIAGVVAAIIAFGSEIAIAIGIMAGLTLIIGSVITSLISFVAYLYMAWKSSETFRTMVVEQFTQMYNSISSIIDNIVIYVKALANNFIVIFKAVLPYLIVIFAFTFQQILKTINTFLDVLNGLSMIIAGTFTGNWGKVWAGVKTIFGNTFNEIINIGKLAINQIIGLVNKAIRALNRIKLPSFFGGHVINLKEIGKLSTTSKVKFDTKASKGGAGASILKTIRNTFSNISSKIKNFKMPKIKTPKIDTDKPENMFAGLTKGLDNLNKKSKKTQEQMDKVNKKVASFVDNVIKQAQSIMDFGGLFEKVVEKKFSGEKFIRAIQSQISSLQDWKKNLKDIGSRIGENSNLYLKLLSMGPEYASQVKGLAKMTDEKLGQYTQLFGQKEGLSYEMGYKMEAGKELQNIKNQQLIFNITGNTIKEDLDIDLIANRIIQKLKIEGVY